MMDGRARSPGSATMIELLPVPSGLPNLHPAVVHFPIALLPAALLFDLLLLFMPGRPWLDRAAATLYALAAAGAFVAVQAGKAAEETIGELAPRVHHLFEEHEHLGTWSLYALAALAIVRALLTWRDLRTDVVPRGFVRFLVLLAGCAAFALLASAADHGGKLVYRHGVAVTSDAPAPPAAPGSHAEPAPPGAPAAN